MRRIAVLVLTTAIVSACGVGELFRQYEYEEDVYLSLDGTATVYVNSSVAALDALRGTSLDRSPTERVDRAKVREFYTTPFTRDVRVTTSRRNKRQFVHVRLEVNDVQALGRAAPFAWSTYRFMRDGDFYVFRQTVGHAAGKAAGRDVVGEEWTGRELVAFRLHLPSKIEDHNREGSQKRGNILVWEQPFADRLRGVSLTLDARMQTQSILYRALGLFGASLAAVALMFGLVIWWILRRGSPVETRTERLRGAGASGGDAGSGPAAR